MKSIYARDHRMVGVWAIALAAMLLALFVALTLPAGAGARDAGVTPRVIGGSVAPPGSWPSQAALLNSSVSDPYNAQFCGGTLIDEHWVLTAAHCVYDGSGNLRPASFFEVAIGINDLDAIGASDRMDVASVSPHPDYDDVTVEWDFALLELEDASSQPTTALISSAEEPLTGGGDPAEIAGWGCAGVSSCTGYPSLLQEAEVEFVADEDCSSTFSYGSQFVPSSMICAGNYITGLPDTCGGDSGGPLIAVGPGDARYLAGVTSWGNGCATALYPGVYSRVLAARGWIDETTQGNILLEVTKSGAGSGTVASGPAGISCGSTCSAYFAEGESVTLTAQPDAGSRFTGWTGACSGTGTCELTLGATTQVGASFEKTGPTVSLTATPPKRTASRTATFRFRASLSGSTFRCNFDASIWKACSSPKTYRNLARGRRHSFRVKATRDGVTGPVRLYRWYVSR